MTTETALARRRPGRPPKPEGALTPAQRKLAQRRRDHAAIHGDAIVIDAVSIDGLLTAARQALARKDAAILADVLKELGHRGGLNVATQKRDRHGKAPKHPKKHNGTVKW